MKYESKKKTNYKPRTKKEYKVDYNELEYIDKDLNKEKYEKLTKNNSLTIEPIRTVSTDEYKKITKKREKKKKRRKKLNKINFGIIINILFVIIIVMVLMITTDYISVNKYNKGPYFALCTKTYDDGGTKEYYGMGYKVIKYNQVQGRRDIEMGSWKLKYNIEPINLSDLELSIELHNNSDKNIDAYYKKFVRLDSTLKKIDEENNKIIIGYKDEDGKYSIGITCKMADKDNNISEFKLNKEITIIGTISDIEIDSNQKPIKVKITGCFAEQ